MTAFLRRGREGGDSSRRNDQRNPDRRTDRSRDQDRRSFEDSSRFPEKTNQRSDDRPARLGDRSDKFGNNSDQWPDRMKDRPEGSDRFEGRPERPRERFDRFANQPERLRDQPERTRDQGDRFRDSSEKFGDQSGRFEDRSRNLRRERSPNRNDRVGDLRNKIKSFPQSDGNNFGSQNRPNSDSSVKFFSSETFPRRDEGPNSQSYFDSKPFPDFRAPNETRFSQPESRNQFGANQLSKEFIGNCKTKTIPNVFGVFLR